MRIVNVPRVPLGHVPLDTALHRVFGEDTLRRMHGSSLKGGGAFREGRRSFSFKVAVDQVPTPIRRFFCGDQLRVTTRQTLQLKEDEYVVVNKLKLHFVGSEFFSIKPSFCLTKEQDGGVTLGGAVRHDAVLPPPLNGIAEEFMAMNTERELRALARTLYEAGALAFSPRPPTNGERGASAATPAAKKM